MQDICKQGHPRNEENLYLKRNGTADCRQCRRERSVVRNLAIKEKRHAARVDLESERPLPAPSLEDVRWAAGCFDGEGTVSISSGGKRGFPFAFASVPNTDRQVVDFYYQRWGGGVREKQSGKRRRLCYEWKVTGRNLRWFLRDMIGHVIRSAVVEKMSIVLSSEEARMHAPKDPNTRAIVLEAMSRIRALNRRGVF